MMIQTSIYQPLNRKILILLILIFVERGNGAEFEKMGQAISKVLGTTKAFKTKVKVGKMDVDVFYDKDKNGKAKKFAILQKGIYEPNCTHTWVIGTDAGSAKVTDIRVIEMSCPHAFPTNKEAFLSQYKGKGPADAKALKSKVVTIAKATGSCQLTTDAVVTAINAAQKLKGQI